GAFRSGCCPLGCAGIPVAKWNKRKLFVRCLRSIRHYPRRDRHSSLDAPAEVIARARINIPATPPSRSKSLTSPGASIRPTVMPCGPYPGGWETVFHHGSGYPVFTEGQSNAVALLLRRAGASTSAGGGL